MVNLLKKFNGQEILFLESQDGRDGYQVCLAKWFKKMPVSETYDSNGCAVEVEQACDECSTCSKLTEKDYLHCKCPECLEYCPQVTAMNYWDGSNYQTVVIESPDYDTYLTPVADEDTISELTEALENAIYDGETTGVTHYNAHDINDPAEVKWRIDDSIWQGNWSLYSIYCLQ